MLMPYLQLPRATAQTLEALPNNVPRDLAGGRLCIFSREGVQH